MRRITKTWTSISLMSSWFLKNGLGMFLPQPPKLRKRRLGAKMPFVPVIQTQYPLLTIISCGITKLRCTYLLEEANIKSDVAQPGGEVVMSVWDRPHESIPNESGASETFIGMVRVPLPNPGETIDGWFPLQRRVHDDRWQGQVRVQLHYRLTQHPEAVSAKDFDLLKVVGKGSFGKVLQVRKKDTGRIYAMKILQKKDIVERQEVAHTLSERNVLIQASSPFLVGLKFSFQTPDKLYLVLDYMNGGELFYQLQKETAFNEARAKFYTAELVLALEHLHKYNIVYRDLKPENILLDGNGHIALTDFGLCKENVAFDETTNTFCGTAEYLAPEVLTGQGYGKPVDWWSLGILLYGMYFLKPKTHPFRNDCRTASILFGKHQCHVQEDFAQSAYLPTWI